MTSVAFILFTLYMLPDPGTTPLKTRGQILFGAALASIYALIQVNHIVFGLMLALSITCGLRGALLWLRFGLPWGRAAAPVTA